MKQNKKYWNLYWRMQALITNARYSRVSERTLDITGLQDTTEKRIEQWEQHI